MLFRRWITIKTLYTKLVTISPHFRYVVFYIKEEKSITVESVGESYSYSVSHVGIRVNPFNCMSDIPHVLDLLKKLLKIELYHIVEQMCTIFQPPAVSHFTKC